MPLLRPAAPAGALALASPCLAAPRPNIPDALRQEAMIGVGEAAQVRPEVWAATDHGLARMIGERWAFSPRCQVVYDKVARALHVTPHDVAKPQSP